MLAKKSVLNGFFEVRNTLTNELFELKNITDEIEQDSAVVIRNAIEINDMLVGLHDSQLEESKNQEENIKNSKFEECATLISREALDIKNKNISDVNDITRSIHGLVVKAIINQIENSEKSINITSIKIKENTGSFAGKAAYNLIHGVGTWWGGPLSETDGGTRFTNFFGFLFWQKPKFTKPKYDPETPDKIAFCTKSAIDAEFHSNPKIFTPK